MKKCTQCGQVLSDDTKFCFKCGGSNYEPVIESGGTYQQPTYQQPSQPTQSPQPPQPPQQSYYSQQPSYQQPAYQQPYQAQPAYNNNEPATIGNFLLFFLFQIIPIFGFVYTIIVAVGSPTRKKSMTNFARAYLIMLAIVVVIYIIIFAVVGVSLANMFGGGYYY